MMDDDDDDDGNRVSVMCDEINDDMMHAVDVDVHSKTCAYQYYAIGCAIFTVPYRYR